MIIEVKGQRFSAALAANETAAAFAELLPMTLSMSELNGNEKYSYLTGALPSAGERVEEIAAGDIMLFGDDCVVLFYQSFHTSYQYTRIGHIEDADGLARALGAGGAEVTFSR